MSFYINQDETPKAKQLTLADHRAKKFEQFRKKLIKILVRLNPDNSARLLNKKIIKEDIFNEDDAFIDGMLQKFKVGDTNLLENFPSVSKNQLPPGLQKVQKSIRKYYNSKTDNSKTEQSQIAKAIMAHKTKQGRAKMFRVQNAKNHRWHSESPGHRHPHCPRTEDKFVVCPLDIQKTLKDEYIKTFGGQYSYAAITQPSTDFYDYLNIGDRLVVHKKDENSFYYTAFEFDENSQEKIRADDVNPNFFQPIKQNPINTQPSQKKSSSTYDDYANNTNYYFIDQIVGLDQKELAEKTLNQTQSILKNPKVAVGTKNTYDKYYSNSRGSLGPDFVKTGKIPVKNYVVWDLGHKGGLTKEDFEFREDRAGSSYYLN